MLALLLFSYACCAVGVWFGWYLRGRRRRRRASDATAIEISALAPGEHPVLKIVYGNAFADGARRAREIVAHALGTAQDSTE